MRSFASQGYVFLRKHPMFAAAALFVFGCVSSLDELFEEILEGDSHDIDTRILLALRNPLDHNDPLGPPWLEEMMRDFTGLGGIGVLTFITLASALYLYVTNKRGMAIYLLCAVASGALLSDLLKIGFDRPRPELVPHGSIVYMASLPSGHSLMSAVVYLTLGSLLAGTQSRHALRVYIFAIAVAIALLVGISRVYLGVHWPSDVLAGWMAGAAWACMFWILAYWRRTWPLNFFRR